MTLKYTRLPLLKDDSHYNWTYSVPLKQMIPIQRNSVLASENRHKEHCPFCQQCENWWR